MSADEAEKPNVVNHERDADEYKHKREEDKQASRLRSERVQLLNQFFAGDALASIVRIAFRIEV